MIRTAEFASGSSASRVPTSLDNAMSTFAPRRELRTLRPCIEGLEPFQTKQELVVNIGVPKTRRPQQPLSRLRRRMRLRQSATKEIPATLRGIYTMSNPPSLIILEPVRSCLGAMTAARCASNIPEFGSAQLAILRLGGNGLQLSTVRILVVDDFEMFRQFVVEVLRKRPELQVVGEASDGLEALHKAVELRPDLILLDIGLPSLNGIEVARQMRSLVSESKIIFLTQEFSSDVVQEALNLGALGYVTKSMVLADLFAAVETVLAGMTFVSNP